jgi:hypothetical protein
LTKFDENQLLAANPRLKARQRLSNMHKPHVYPRLPALTPEDVTAM